MTAAVATAPAAVTVEAVAKTFPRGDTPVAALEDATIAIADGEFVSIVGPSGCGKSTLLRIVAGLLSPSLGTVRVSGEQVTGPPPQIGMMFQRPVLLDWRTARENVLLPLELADGRRSARTARAQADELLATVGLEGFEERYPGELSGGMQQRVAICRMLIADPDVLLLDEPFGALDELTRERLNMELARIVADRRKTAILVTHNIQEAVLLSNRVVVMSARPGRITGVVDVTLPQPRTLDDMTDVHFQQLCRDVRVLLDGTSAGAATTPTEGRVR